MKQIALFLRRYHIFHKRFYYKKGFLALLLLIPVIGLALGLTAKMDSGIMTVALASEDDDTVARDLIDTLLCDHGVVRFVEANTAADAVSLVERGRADAAWIFSADLAAVSDRFAEKQTARNAIVHIVQREEGILQMLLREKLCGVLYPHVSERYYLQFVRKTLAEAGVDAPDEGTLIAYFDAQTPEGAELFDFHFTETAVDAGGAILTAPLRGLLSVMVVLSALAVSMFYKMDTKNGVFTGFSKASMPFFTLGYHFAAVFDVGIAMLLSLYAAGMCTALWTELIYLVLFTLAASLFAMILERVCKKLALLAALTPLLTLGMIVICPVFFTVYALGFLPYLFPPQYYIMGMAGAMSVVPMLGYIAVLGALYAVLSLVSARYGTEE